MDRIYLDNAATTPVRKEVLKKMLPFFSDQFGNPGSLHSFGQEAMGAIDLAREEMSELLKTDFHNVIFCGSATEANNLIIRGAVSKWKGSELPRIIVSSIEHESILDTVKTLEAEGRIELILLPVTKEGVVSLRELKEVLNKNTALVSVMYVNNEVGVIQPLKEIAHIISEFKKENNSEFPIYHSDCVQAFSYFDCSFESIDVDAITISGHKCGGPKGIGILALSPAFSNKTRTLTSDTYPVSAIITGGGQEFGLRSGTENVANIVGCVEALKISFKEKENEHKRLEKIKEKTIKKFLALFPKSEINGGASAPHIVNFHLQELGREEFLVQADLLGVALSSGSACSARSHEVSHVLSAMYGAFSEQTNSVRISFGYQTTEQDIENAFKLLEEVFKRS